MITVSKLIEGLQALIDENGDQYVCVSDIKSPIYDDILSVGLDTGTDGIKIVTINI